MKHLLPLLFRVLLLPSLLVMTSSQLIADNLEIEENNVEVFLSDNMDEEHSVGKIKRTILKIQRKLQQTPDNSRLRLELALAYYQLRNFEQALASLKQVLLDTSIPPQVKKNTLLFKKKIEREQLRANEYIHLKGDFTLFAGIDSNANVAPPDVNIDIGTLTESSTATKDNYRAMSLSLKHYTALTKPSLSIIKDYKLFWFTDVNSIVKDYSSINTSDLAVFSLRTGPLIRKDKWQYDFKVNAEHIMLGSKSLANYYGFTPSIAYHVDNTTFTIKPSYTQRKYLNDYDYDKDGHQHGMELSYSKKDFMGFSFQVSAAIRSLDLRKNYHSYTSYKYALYLLKNVNPALSFTGYSSYERSHYAEVEDFYSDKRQDKIWRNILAMKYKIDKELFVGLKFSYYKRTSNHGLYVYDRKRLELHLGYSF